MTKVINACICIASGNGEGGIADSVETRLPLFVEGRQLKITEWLCFHLEAKISDNPSFE